MAPYMGLPTLHQHESRCMVLAHWQSKSTGTGKMRAALKESFVSTTRPPVLDEIDRQLIAALQLNARESVAMLARQLGIARTTVTSRLARLESSNVITGYGVRLSQRVVDGGLQAYVGITVQPRSGKEVLRRLSSLAQVQQLCAVSGEFDYVAWLRTDSPEQLDQLLDLIGSVDGVEKTTTSIILSSKIDRGQPV